MSFRKRKKRKIDIFKGQGTGQQPPKHPRSTTKEKRGGRIPSGDLEEDFAGKKGEKRESPEGGRGGEDVVSEALGKKTYPGKGKSGFLMSREGKRDLSGGF